jgi:predicted lipoprotein with Yx(FWY)xxD motif
MNRRAFAGSVASAIAVIGVMSACGYGDESSSDSAESADVSTLSTNLGTVIVDGDGRAMYAFDKDQVNPPASACSGDCAAIWPPVPATEDVDGIDAGLVGALTRDDGSEQLTINGNPVYLFAQDTAAGDTKGHGVNGVWHALSPDGSKL